MKPKFEKYIPFPHIANPDRQWPNKELTKAPVWCSVDLRDGNQALINPMNLDEKLEMFHTLIDIGVKEIEVGFPSASETEYEILRTLIEGGHIPDDVTIQVLVQCREHLIRKTFDAIDGAKNVIVHFYNSTSALQRKVVFKTDVQGVEDIAVEGARLVRRLTDELLESHPEMNIRFEYSPESWMGTEVDVSVRICQRVLEELRATTEEKVILNLPTTVENMMPNYTADMLEVFMRDLPWRDRAIISLHPHNDRGTGVATAELGLLAGADRVEATLFGNGERTGNVDIVTLGMNMYMQGVDPELDFSDMPDICQKYSEYTDMSIDARSPYSGALVFAAFSGSHQDAIAKGMTYRLDNDPDRWTVPYLPIDPTDIGRNYDADVIRINSQSGKGGVGYILERNYGLNLPPKMREEMGYAAKDLSDHLHKELQPDEIYSLFLTKFKDITKPFDINGVHFKQEDKRVISAEVNCRRGDEEFSVVKAKGNGRLNAVSLALKKKYHLDYELVTYQEHALTQLSSSEAIAYVGIQNDDGKIFWGAGIDSDIIRASIDALLTAINNAQAE